VLLVELQYCVEETQQEDLLVEGAVERKEAVLLHHRASNRAPEIDLEKLQLG
jgi:hypothetical protein